MPDFLFNDSVQLSGTRLTEDGYLVSEAFAVRTGIQIYTGDEVDPNNEYGLKSKPFVRVYRSEDEVRSPKSLQSFSHAPVTIGHPPGGVTADSWKELAVGEVSTEAVWDGNKIKLPLVIKDSKAVAGIHRGNRELSAGYRCVIDAKPGITPDGQPYDASQKDIRINHLAIVPQGRAGSECRIGDSANWGPSPQPTEQPMTLKHIVIGDSTAQVSVEDADKVTKFIGDMRDAHTAVVDAKDKEIATKDARIQELERGQLTDAQLDERVAARQAVIADANLLVKDANFSGMSLADIRKKAVVANDAECADKSEAYIDAMFDIKVKDAKKVIEDTKKSDPAMRSVITGDSNTNVVDHSFGNQDRVTKMVDAWKQGA